MMKKISMRLLPAILAIIMMSGMLGFDASAADENLPAGGDIQAAIDRVKASGGGKVTVTGSVTNRATTLNINIPDGVTVEWEATYRGTANPLINIDGAGVFIAADGAWIQNTSAGNSFTAIRAREAIRFVVDGGTVQAGKGRAIEGAGTGAAVTITVSEGMVFNEATNNLFPAIDMTATMQNPASPITNVIINGGKVFSDPDPLGAATVYGYVIQTYGIVEINGGEVYTTGKNGRCINLVGSNSEATVSGGEVYATGANGVAISTSTTSPGQVTNTKVNITGGFVASYATDNGWAIRTTGANSTVNVSGGCVFGIGYNTQFSNQSLTSVPAPATNSVIFLQGRVDGFTGPGGGVVIAWDRNAWNTSSHDRAPYNENATRHITTSSDAPPPNTAKWVIGAPVYANDGILYAFGDYSGFIQLPEVVVSGQRTIKPVADSGGSVTPDGIQTVLFGGTATFNYAPDSGNTVSSVEVINAATGSVIDRVVAPSARSYTIGVVRHDLIFVVHFQAIPPGFSTIVAFAGANGSVSPSGLSRVTSGTLIERVIEAEGGYHISKVMLDGRDVTNELSDTTIDAASGNLTKGTYTIPELIRNSVLSVVFEEDLPTNHTIGVIVGENGRITPSGFPEIVGKGTGSIPVPAGGSRTFTITPDPGYYIEEVIIDEASVTGIRNVYEIADVDDDHTIEANFAEIEYEWQTITATAGAGGRLVPAGPDPDEDPDQPEIVSPEVRELEVPYGANQLFYIEASRGYAIKEVLVDGELVVITDGRYTFTEVIEDCTIEVAFEWVGFPSGPKKDEDENKDDGEDQEPDDDPDSNPSHQHPGAGLGGDSDVSHILEVERHIRYIQGVGKNLFQPARDMTRAEVVQMFFNLLLEQNVETKRRFPDETEGAWHSRAVLALASLGVVEGREDGMFHPEDGITRAEFVAIAARFAAGLPEITDDTPFSDVSDNNWAYKYIHASEQFGWILGYSDGAFKPERHISRAEAVTIMNRVLNRVPDREFIDGHPDLNQFTDVPRSHWAYYDIMEAFIAHDYTKENGVEHWEE